MEDKDAKQIVSLLESLNKKMSVLLGEQIRQEKMSVKDQVSRLYAAGLDTNAIAEVVNISKNHANKEISALKKKK